MSSFPPAELRPILEELATLLAESSSPIKIGVAETSTGGLISAGLLSIPGASRWYAGGATLYTRNSRKVWGGWTDKSLEGYKGPTEEIVVGLATHVRLNLDATYCIGESGTAGPGVPGPEYIYSIPGNVSLAVVSADGAISQTVTTGLGKNREGNMVAFAVAGLKLLRDVLKGEVKLVKSSL